MVKRIGKSMAFLVVGAMLLFGMQSIFTPKWSDDGATNRVISGFLNLENNTVDVLFLGTSYMGRGVSPMKIYEDAEICSYNLATSGQPLACSYFLLKEAFKTQSPKVVFLEAGRIMDSEGNNSNAYWRYIIDNFPRDDVFLELADAYGQIPGSDGTLSALFPIIKYHTRWDKLTADDFKRENTGSYYSAGQYVMSYCPQNLPTRENIDNRTERLLTKEEEETEVKARSSTGVLPSQTVKKSVYSPELTDYGREYVLKIKELCEENGAELVLIKMPVFLYPTITKDVSWNRVKSGIIKKFAREYNIDFFDTMYDYNVIDSKTDMHDDGHLNCIGAEKISVFLEKILKKYDVRSGTNEQYEENSEKYHEVAAIAKLQSENDFQRYMCILVENRKNWTILISACDEYTNSLTPLDYHYMWQLGLRLVQSGQLRDSYLAVIDSGEVLYEAVSEGKLSYEVSVRGKDMEINSAGYAAGSFSNIFIQEEDYSVGGRGLNIVVIDNETDLIIDSVRFDTFSEYKTADRNKSDTYSRLREYEDRQCFQ